MAATPDASSQPHPESVILVHGLWMNGLDLALLRWRLKDAGYRTYQFSYRSAHGTLKQHAQRLRAFIDGTPGEVVHIVAHSLGGLVTLELLDEELGVGRPGKIVFLGSPVRGSAVARSLSERGLGRIFLGGVEEPLTRFQARAWTGTHPIGTLAGTKRFGVGWMFTRLPEPHDGTVAMEETVLEGAVDSTSVHTSHTGMLVDRTVARRVINFLKEGEFGR